MNSAAALLPLSVIIAGALIVLLFEAFLRREHREWLGYAALVFLALAGALSVRFWNDGLAYFQGKLSLDRLAIFLTLFFCLAVGLVILLSLKYIRQQEANHGELFALLLLALSGLMIMTSSADLLVIFLGLEVLSVSSYAMAALRKKDEASGEAGLKYFLLGSFASAFLVFGLAFLYAAASSTDIPAIMVALAAGRPVIGLVGVGFFFVGIAFKIAAVPFHMWTPDVYEGAPTPITAFFSVATKSAGFIVLLRFFLNFWEAVPGGGKVFWAISAISLLTMVVGNLVALRQRNIKRLLAYSSIAHAGYLLLAILARDPGGLVFYLTAYLFMNTGAFAAVIAMSRKGKEYLELEDYSGIGFTYPWIGGTLTVFLLSLAGFPPTAGFLAKFYVFSAAVRAGLVPLVVAAVLTSLISVYYYLRVVVFMYMREPESDIAIETENPALFLVLFLCLYGVLQLGIFPGNILVFIRQAAASLGL